MDKKQTGWFAGCVGYVRYVAVRSDEAVERSEYMKPRIAVITLFTYGWFGIFINPTWHTFLSCLLSLTVAFGLVMNAAYKKHTELETTISGLEGQLNPPFKFILENGRQDNYSNDHGPLGDGQNPCGTYLRLKVINTSGKNLTGFQGIFVSIEKDGCLHSQGRQPLNFSPHLSENPPTRTLNINGEDLIDIFRVDVASNRIAITSRDYRRSAIDSSNKYLYETKCHTVLNIEIVSNEIGKVELKLNFSWNETRWNLEPAFSIKEIRYAP